MKTRLTPWSVGCAMTALLAAALTLQPGEAATFTVSNTNQSGAGSLPQAILDANASAGADFIAFNILSAGLNIAPNAALPAITEAVTIDGTTQPSFAGSPLIEISGQSAGAGVDGFRILSGGSVIRSLIINRFLGDGIELTNGGNNLIAGNWIGLNNNGTLDQGNTFNGITVTNSPNNTIGGLATVDRNVISGNNQNGVFIQGLAATGNAVLGNYIGLNATGGVAVANSLSGVLINHAPANTVGGTAAAARNVISGNSQSGVRIENTNAYANLVAGNYLGTSTNGITDLGNGNYGVLLFNARSNTVGGVTAGHRNVIAGNNVAGVRIEGANATTNAVRGNFIGTTITGASALPNGGPGVHVLTSAAGNTIGGAAAGEANVIAFNSVDGVWVQAGTNNAIRANLIHSNGGLGIDVDLDGVLANDAGDTDVGANQRQNHPLLTGATNSAGGITIAGTMNSTASQAFTVDFYASSVPDATGSGEGEFYLGNTAVNTAGDGNTTFQVTLPSVALGRWVTATATDANGNTSEFSPAVRAESTLVPATFTVVNTNDFGAGSLRQAIIDNNLAVSSANNVIQFAIPNSGPHVIRPAAALPTFLEAATVNGFTQSGAVSNTLATGNSAVWMIHLDGVSAGTGANGLRFASSGNVVRGLQIFRFNSDGLEFTNSHNNVVVGNSLGRLDETGVTFANTGDGVHLLQSSNNRLGGALPGDRNIIAGNGSDGIEINGTNSVANLVLGNHIGTDGGGTVDRGNLQSGILISGAPNNTIGGTAAGAGNLLSGNTQEGLEINGLAATNNVVLGNRIGTEVTGLTGLGNAGAGVLLANNSRFNLIGGLAAGAGNRIAFNGGDGINVANGTNNALRANLIWTNSALGIDLDPNGLTANDAGDIDAGGNQLQNFPVITNAMLNAGSTVIQGTFNSTASTTFALDFFQSVFRDVATVNGEGQFYLGSANVVTDGSGNATFDVNLPTTATGGRWITATATDPNGNSSEFSGAFTATSLLPGQPFLVTNTNDAGPGSLRQAILENNLTFNGAPNTLNFAITSAEPHVITPATVLPTITAAVIVNGYSQAGASANTLATGNNAVLKIRIDGNAAFFNGLRVAAAGTVVRGLSFTRFSNPMLQLDAPGFASVEGCFFGLDTDGVTSFSPASEGVNVNNSPGNAIGGSAPAQRNVFGGLSTAIALASNGAVSNTVTGNYIGTDRHGTGGSGNLRGITINGGRTNSIGGTTAALRNVISSNRFFGLQIIGTGSAGNRVVGNYLGLNAAGTGPMGNGTHGIDISSSTAFGNVIGGIAAGEANVIAHSGQNGLNVSSGTNNTLRGNSIYNSGYLGIDLGGFGLVTFNDAGDADTGANQLQNFPVVTGGQGTLSGTTIQGTLNSKPSETFQLDFYSNPATEGDGYGEGRKYLGSGSTTTGADSNAVFSINVAGVMDGRHVTATATDANGNTSEFSLSAPLAVTFAPTTFTVVNTNDAGPGSLRQAILESNFKPSGSRNTIAFNITGAGPHVIRPLTPLPTLVESALIDGYSQPGAAANTAAIGFNAVLQIVLEPGTPFLDGLTLDFQNSVLRGLVMTEFGAAITVRGTGHVIEGCVLGLTAVGLPAPNAQAINGLPGSSNNVIGGITPAARNVIAGRNSAHAITLQNTTGWLIQGNFIGTDLSGLNTAGSQAGGISISSGTGNVVGGTAPGAGNVIGGNDSGDGVSIYLGFSNRVEGNLIGVGADGVTILRNSPAGVSIENSAQNVVGGSSAGARNIISGNGTGVSLAFSGTSSNYVVGNFIGTDLTGTLPVPNYYGVSISADTNFIGGVLAGEGNRIAFNQGDGILVGGGTGNALRGNEVFANGGIGIGLGFSVVTPNDPGDPDAGANNLQNFPVLASGSINVASTAVGGALNSTPSTQFTLDFFANTAPDPAGNGEGQQYLGATTATTDGAGNAVFSVSLPRRAVGRYLTATATDPAGNTSEFSAAFRAASTQPGLTFTVTTEADSGPGSLRQAMLNSETNHAGANNVIQFALYGPGPHTIAPTTELPLLREAVTIDGFTQSEASANTQVNTDNAVRKIRLDGFATAGAYFDGLKLAAGGSVIRGLWIRNYAGNAIEITSSGNVVEGCYLTENNSPLVINSGAGNRIGGTTPAQRNVIVGNATVGVYVYSTASSGTLVQGNFIGLNPDGISTSANDIGVQFADSPLNVVGGSEAARNFIVGNAAQGVLIDGTGSVSNRVEGNFIGVRPDGAVAGNGGPGILLSGGSDNVIGAPRATPPGQLSLQGIPPATGVMNAIAANLGAGIEVVAGVRNSLRRNLVYSNRDLAIDLAGDGVTDNDVLDGDPGPNNLQNFPVINSATIGAGNITLIGSLAAAPNTSYQIDIYSNVNCDSPSLHGEGQYWRGSFHVTTSGAGTVNFNQTVNQPGIGSFITATATDPVGNTSEFSRCVLGDCSDNTPRVFLVTNTNSSGPGSLANAVDQANAGCSPATINFNIAGAGEKRIFLFEPLILSSRITINFANQGGGGVIIDGSSLPAGDSAINIVANYVLVQGANIQNIGAAVQVGAPAAPVSNVTFTGNMVNVTGRAGILAYLNSSTITATGKDIAGNFVELVNGTGNTVTVSGQNVGGDLLNTMGNGSVAVNLNGRFLIEGSIDSREGGSPPLPPIISNASCTGPNTISITMSGSAPANFPVTLTPIYFNKVNPKSGIAGTTVVGNSDAMGEYLFSLMESPPTGTVAVSGLVTIAGNSSEASLPVSLEGCAVDSPFIVLPFENHPLAGVAGDPISTFNGELYDTLLPDLNLGGPMPLLFQRFYGSALGRATLLPRLGTNWTHNFEATLTNSATAVGISLPPGLILAFTNQAGVFTLLNRADLPFQLRTSGANYLLADPRDQRVFTFNSSGQLTQIADSRGNAHTLAYAGALLSSATDGLGRTLTFSYSAGGSLTNVSDGTRNAGFQQSGNLLAVSRTPLNLPTTNNYTVSGPFGALLQSSQRPVGNTPLTQFYAGSAVTSQGVASSPPSTIQYVGPVTTVTDPLGFQTQDQHTTNGLLVRHTDAGGRDILLGYDSAGRRTNVTDRLGRSTGIGYHAPSGNVAAITNADGSVLRYDYTSRTFNALTLHDVRQITLPDGRIEQFLNDANGNVVGYTNRGGFVTRISYNARGQVLTATNAAGGVVTYTYDAAGRLLTSRDSETGNTTFAYDQFSRLTNVVHPDSAARRLTWDADDRLTSTTDERGNNRAFGYDSNGRLTTTLDPLGAVSRFAYDLADRLVGTTNRLGDAVTRSINDRGEVVQVANEQSENTLFTYDARGRLTTLRDGGFQNWNFSYDDEDRLTSFENPLGERLTFARDVLGAVVGATNPLGHVTKLQRDVMRRPTNRIDALGRQFQFGYDARGLLTNVVHPGVGAAAYQRDPLGNLTRLTDLNARQWNFNWSAMGRLLSVADPLNRSNRFDYDNRGRLARAYYADNSIATNTYDPAGNVTRRQHSAGPDLPFTYDALNRLSTAHDLAFAYDAEGRVTNTVSGGLNFGAAYDRAGRLTSITYSNDSFTVNYYYDSRGLAVSASGGFGNGYLSWDRDAAGRIVAINRGNGAFGTLTYDDDGRLTRIKDGSVLDLRYTYNTADEVTGADLQAPALPSDFAFSNTNNFTYDAAHQVSTTGYTYDARGRMTALAGKPVSYDGASRVVSAGGVTYTYNGLGQVLTRTENGVTRRYYYNHAMAGSPIMMERDDAPGTTLRYYVWAPDGALLWMIDAADVHAVSYYHFDRVGTTLALTDSNGTVTDAYAWTPFGELVRRTGTSTQPFTYVGRWGVRADNGLFHMRARWYDPKTAAFLTRDPVWPRLTQALELNPYDYAADQPLEFADPAGRYPRRVEILRNSPRAFNRSDRELEQVWVPGWEEAEEEIYEAKDREERNGVAAATGATTTAAAGFIDQVRLPVLRRHSPYHRFPPVADTSEPPDWRDAAPLTDRPVIGHADENSGLNDQSGGFTVWFR